MTIKIAGIAGSLRHGSVNRMLLHAAAEHMAADVDFTVFDQLDRVPPVNEDWEGARSWPSPELALCLPHSPFPAPSPGSHRTGGSPTPG
jgi:hypothetical protein